MGTLYREVVESKHSKTNRLMLRLMFGLLVIDTAFVLYIMEGTIEKTIYLGLSIMIFSAVSIIVLWVKSNKCYRYGIVDRELIIERLSGDKRTVALNINLSQILYVCKVIESSHRVTVDGEFRFTCAGKKNKVYRCVYEKEGKIYSFNFEPSSSLLKKIEMYR